LSKRKLLTVAGSAIVSGPLPELTKVRAKVPPVTSRLAQQFSAHEPQSLKPVPPRAQLAGGTAMSTSQVDAALSVPASAGEVLAGFELEQLRFSTGASQSSC
jgi:hypothetical protein